MLVVAPELLAFAAFFAIVGVCMTGVYILPSIIAVLRGHRNAGAIIVLNILLGWSFVGWVVALIWSLTDNVGQRRFVRYEGVWRRPY